jgi:hypothetical protein
MPNYFENKAEKEIEKISKEKQRPDWVSDSNLSVKAYNYLLEKEAELRAYIARHKNISDFKAKKSYHISARSVATALGCAANSLTDELKVTFAEGFNKYLKNLNIDLLKAKDDRIEAQEKRQSRGLHEETKDELVVKAKSLKDQIKEIKEKNVHDQVEQIFNQLDKPICEKLRIKAATVHKFK